MIFTCLKCHWLSYGVDAWVYSWGWRSTIFEITLNKYLSFQMFGSKLSNSLRSWGFFFRNPKKPFTCAKTLLFKIPFATNSGKKYITQIPYFCAVRWTCVSTKKSLKMPVAPKVRNERARSARLNLMTANKGFFLLVYISKFYSQRKSIFRKYSLSLEVTR